MPAGWLLFFALASPPQEPPGSGRASLEEVLERLRERRDAARVVLAPRVRELIARLDLLFLDAPPDVQESLRAELRGLPPEAAPMIVPHLDPGAEATLVETRSADELALALEVIGIGGVVDELAELARIGSARGRERAVRLLVRSGEETRQRVLAVLLGLWEDGPPDIATEVLAALLDLSGEDSAKALASAALGAGEPGRIDAALEALRRTGKSAREGVRGILAHPVHAEGRLEALLAYYLDRPAEFALDEAALLFGQVERSGLSEARRAALLERLPELVPAARGAKVEWLDLLRDLSTRTSGELSTACRVALARLGDRAARRDLMENVGARFADPKSPEACVERGRILLRLGDPDEAARDFQRAFEIVLVPLEQRQPIGILLARALCRSGKLRQASETLGEIRLRPGQRSELASDPDFAELAAHARYGEVLR